jgi:hypothetical protein
MIFFIIQIIIYLILYLNLYRTTRFNFEYFIKGYLNKFDKR